MQLDGKVAVVTGSGNGIGEAIARRFAAARARVVVTDIEQEAVERVADELGTVGIAADISAADSVRAVADLARATYGEVDLWLSNAGVAGPRQPRSLQDDGLWDLMWRLHMLSHLHAVREVLPSMIARGDGYLLQNSVFGGTVDPAGEGRLLGYRIRCRSPGTRAGAHSATGG